MCPVCLAAIMVATATSGGGLWAPLARVAYLEATGRTDVEPLRAWAVAINQLYQASFTELRITKLPFTIVFPRKGGQ